MSGCLKSQTPWFIASHRVHERLPPQRGAQANAKPSATSHLPVRTIVLAAFAALLITLGGASHRRTGIPFPQRRFRQRECRSLRSGSPSIPSTGSPRSRRLRDQALGRAPGGGGSEILRNGPINGNTDAWTINFGFVASDTFYHPERRRQP